jgi:hypothetical protein
MGVFIYHTDALNKLGLVEGTLWRHQQETDTESGSFSAMQEDWLCTAAAHEQDPGMFSRPGPCFMSRPINGFIYGRHVGMHTARRYCCLGSGQLAYVYDKYAPAGSFEAPERYNFMIYRPQRSRSDLYAICRCKVCEQRRYGFPCQ